jgi:lipopolysaccharide export system permease protein
MSGCKIMKINYRKLGLKRLDTYIIFKFLGTYFFSILMILSIAIVFDLTEKLDKFYESHAPFSEIVLHYYLPFIPFYMNMFSPLFTFIALIFFTSKMAGNTEVIAILASGTSFARFTRPYFISAAIIALISFLLGGYIIPRGNQVMLDFSDKYIQKYKSDNAQNVQMEVQSGVILYIERFEKSNNNGYRMSLEKFKGKQLVSRLTAQSVSWVSGHKWHINDYLQRDFNGLREKITKGISRDTTINVSPQEFFLTGDDSKQMTIYQLANHLNLQKERGIGNIQCFEDEYIKRFSRPLAAFIMTLIGVSLASRKVRGGTGLHLGVGLALSAIYIIFDTMSTTFSVGGVMSVAAAVWLPNIVFLMIGLYLYRTAPK